MKAIIVYGIEDFSWGDSDERSGVYLTRYTVALKPDGSLLSVVDRKPIAKIEDTSERLTLNDLIKSDQFVMLPHEWNFNTLDRVRKR